MASGSTPCLCSRARQIADNLHLTGLIDPTLPPVLDEARAAVDEIATNAYMALHAGCDERPGFFIQFSPMTHDPLFSGKLVKDPAITSYTVVHDFIPFREPGRYLSNPAERLRYHLGMKWLF